MMQMQRGLNGQESCLPLKMLVDAMKRWAIRFKDRQPDPAEMTFLAKEFLRDLADEGVTPDEFSAADRHVCKNNRFFPVMADILAAVRELRDQRYAMDIKRLGWRRENAWKANFPEMLSQSERLELGVTVEAMEDSVERGYIGGDELADYIRKLSEQKSIPAN